MPDKQIVPEAYNIILITKVCMTFPIIDQRLSESVHHTVHIIYVKQHLDAPLALVALLNRLND